MEGNGNLVLKPLTFELENVIHTFLQPPHKICKRLLARGKIVISGVAFGRAWTALASRIFPRISSLEDGDPDSFRPSLDIVYNWFWVMNRKNPLEHSDISSAISLKLDQMYKQ